MNVQETSSLSTYLHAPKIKRSLWYNFYKLILLLLLSAFINSCTKDNFSSTVKQKEKSIAKVISINDLREDLNSNASIDLNRISAQSAAGQLLEEFTIDSTKILLTNNDRNESFYSMRLISKKENSRKFFYNLFIIKDSVGSVKRYIIKFTPTLETIKNGYKNFKGTYEILKEVSSPTGQIKSNATSIISNAIGCYEIAFDIPCIYGYVHGDGNGPGPWCNGDGSYKLFIDICSGNGSVGYTTGTTNNSNNNGTVGNNVLVTPTYDYDIVHCEDSNIDNFIFNTYVNYQTWANNHLNEFNQLLGGLCADFSENWKAEIIIILDHLSADPYVDQEALQNYNDDLSIYNNENDTTLMTFDCLNDQWPVISPVIPASQFVGYDGRNCILLARAQIAIKGLRDLGSGNVFQAYKASSGYNVNAAKNGVDYIISKLKKGHPVMVGVDNQDGSKPENPDGTTDHFIVVVACGSDAKGKFLQFYDNATNLSVFGANKYNRLYYNLQTGEITGRTSAGYANAAGRHDYIVTHIRKNK